jgi:hypothetical protein
MTRIGDALREADPLRDDPSLCADDVRAIRQLVVETARQEGHANFFWLQSVAVAAVVVTMIGVGITAGRRLPALSSAPPASSQTARGADRDVEPRQLQFATPGGTRIIWLFDPQFSLKETMP